MHLRLPLVLIIVLFIVRVPSGSIRQEDPAAPDPHTLAAIWDAVHVSSVVPALVDHAEVVHRLEALTAAAPELFIIERVGHSVEGRALHHVRVGNGPMRVFMWSQMHGDEPTATAALLDLFEYLRRHRRTPVVERLLTRLTLHAVPMLNPDGAERFQRRNAQGIDINRDALRLQTPEGRVLKALRDRLQPAIGFNLHNQSWRTSVGRPPRPASISLLAVVHDEARTESVGRTLTKKTAAIIRDALEPFAEGQIGRYSDEFEERAFGDNITLWGTPVVLVETGPWPGPDADRTLVRLNFVALVTALDALASGRVAQADPTRYETLPLNESRLFAVLVRGATVITGSGVAPFTADIGIGVTRTVRRENGRREFHTSATIEELGDLRTHGALRTIDATGMTVAPAVEGMQIGQVVELPDWRTRTKRVVAVGQPARIAVLTPTATPGLFRVDDLLP